MSGSSNIPTIFIGSVDDGKDPKQLRQNIREKAAISQILTLENQDRLFQVLEETEPGNKQLVRQLFFKNRINVIHLAGSAEAVWKDHPRSLQLDDIWEEWVDLLNFIPNLDAVFLSGCATPKRIRTLIKQDLPAVLVTEAKNKDARITDIATIFYRELALGKSIWDAFEAVNAQYPAFQAHKLTYHVENDWVEGYEELLSGAISWGLYYLDDHEGQLKKSYKSRKIIPLIPQQEKGMAGLLIRKGMTWLKYSGIVAGGGLLASVITFLLSRFFLY